MGVRDISKLFIIHSSPPNKREKSVTKEIKSEIKSETILKSKSKKKPSPSKTPMKKEGIKVQTPKKSPGKRSPEIKTETIPHPSVENTEKNPKAGESDKPKVNPFFISKKDTKNSVKENVESLSYNPAKSNYHPINDTFWKHGEK